MQEQPASALSREFFQATDANHPLNLPNNVTGDNGLVFTEDLLLLHRSVWSLPDGEILSHMKRMDSMLMDDNKWKVWVRRLMVCVSEPVNPPSEETWTCSNSNHTCIPIALNAANSVSSFLPDMHPNRPQLTGVHHTAISNGLSFNPENTPACDQYYHHAGHDVERSPAQEVPTPSTLVGSETSTPSTTYESFSPPGSKETEFFVRRVPSPPAHASLGYHDTGAGAGILFKGDSSLPFVEEDPNHEARQKTSSQDSMDVEVDSLRMDECLDAKIPKHLRGSVPSSMLFTWRACEPAPIMDLPDNDAKDFVRPPLEPSVGPIRGAKPRKHRERPAAAHAPTAFITDNYDADCKSFPTRGGKSSSDEGYTPVFPNPLTCQWGKDPEGNPVTCSYVFTTSPSAPDYRASFLAELEAHMKEAHLPPFRSDLETDSRGRIMCAWKGCSTPRVMYPSLLVHLRSKHFEVEFRCEKCGAIVKKGNEKSRHRVTTNTGASRCDINRMISMD
ncbi:hypothetical protein AAF712_012280 [Marasmius tenuissimus]|uniref:C2H2-type domain-containing protein n=1 Tax=Marasmius tenuissimus TaxID=585030 RepID=A0ABR2ZI15_9AGAR